MSAFRPRNLASSDLSALVTDPDLASAEDRLAAVLATRASQSSVDNLGATLGPAIVDATADKATAAQVAAAREALQAEIAAALDSTRVTGEIRLVNKPDGQPTPGWSKAGGLPTTAIPTFNNIRLVLAPYDKGVNGVDAYTLLYGSAASHAVSGMHYYAGTSTYMRRLNLETGAWQDLPATSATLRRSAIVGDLLLQWGGSTAPSVGTRGLNLTTMSWSNLANYPLSIYAPVGCSLADGRVLSIGGTTSTTVTATTLQSSIQYYNREANAWQPAPTSFPVRIYGGQAVQRPDGKVYVHATHTSDGSTLTSLSRRTWLLDPTDNSAVECDPWPNSLTPGAFYVLADGRLKVSFIGATSATTAGAVLDPSQPAGSQWTFVEFWYDPVFGSVSNCSGTFSNGMVPLFLGVSTSALFGLYVDNDVATRPDPARTFYEVKN